MSISSVGAPGAVYTPPIARPAPPPAPPASVPTADKDGDGDSDKGGVDIKV